MNIDGYTVHVGRCGDCPCEYEGFCTHPSLEYAERFYVCDEPAPPKTCPLREGTLLIQLRSGV